MKKLVILILFTTLLLSCVPDSTKRMHRRQGVQSYVERYEQPEIKLYLKDKDGIKSINTIDCYSWPDSAWVIYIHDTKYEMKYERVALWKPLLKPSTRFNVYAEKYQIVGSEKFHSLD